VNIPTKNPITKMARGNKKDVVAVNKKEPKMTLKEKRAAKENKKKKYG